MMVCNECAAIPRGILKRLAEALGMERTGHRALWIVVSTSMPRGHHHVDCGKRWWLVGHPPF